MSVYPKRRALTHTVHEALQELIKCTFNKAAENKTCLLSFSPLPICCSHLFLQASFHILFPFFFPSVKKDFHWNSCSQGPAPTQGQDIIGWPIYPAVLFILSSSFPPLSPPLHPPGFGLITDMQDGSCLLRISIANEAEEKEVQLECVETGAALWSHSQLRPNQGRRHTRWDGRSSQLTQQPSECVWTESQNPILIQYKKI